MAVVKGRLEPKTYLPCCLLPWPSYPPAGGHFFSLFTLPFPAFSDSRCLSLSVNGFQGQDWSGGWRQDVQNEAKEQGPLCLRVVICSQPEPQDWIPSGQSTGHWVLYWSPSSPALLTSRTPGTQGSCYQCPLFISIFVLWRFYPRGSETRSRVQLGNQTACRLEENRGWRYHSPSCSMWITCQSPLEMPEIADSTRPSTMFSPIYTYINCDII